MRSLALRACDGVTSRPRDGVTSRDGETPRPCNDVTSDVIRGLAPKLPVWELVLGIENLAPAQDVDVPLPYPQLEHLIGEDRRSITAVPERTLNCPRARGRR
jgi:hypothetical protein